MDQAVSSPTEKPCLPTRTNKSYKEGFRSILAGLSQPLRELRLHMQPQGECQQIYLITTLRLGGSITFSFLLSLRYVPDVGNTKMNVAQFLLSNISQGEESHRKNPVMQWNVLVQVGSQVQSRKSGLFPVELGRLPREPEDPYLHTDILLKWKLF